MEQFLLSDFTFRAEKDYIFENLLNYQSLVLSYSSDRNFFFKNSFASSTTIHEVTLTLLYLMIRVYAERSASISRKFHSLLAKAKSHTWRKSPSVDSRILLSFLIYIFNVDLRSYFLCLRVSYQNVSFFMPFLFPWKWSKTLILYLIAYLEINCFDGPWTKLAPFTSPSSVSFFMVYLLSLLQQLLPRLSSLMCYPPF